MPVSPEQFGLSFPNDNLRGNLATRFVTNMRETVGAMPQGLWMLGKAGVGDIGRGIGEIGTLGRIDTDFQTPELGGAMWKGFKEESFIPALLTGNPREALRRANERPFDATLDFTGLAFGGYGTVAKGASLAAPLAKGSTRALLMRPSGYRPAAEIIDDPNLLRKFGDRPEEIGGGFPFAAPITSNVSDSKFQLKNVGDDLYARRVARRMKDSDDNRYNVWSRRSSNELAAKLGDVIQSGFGKLPEAAPFVGSLSRINNQLKKDKYSIRGLDRDRMRISYDSKRDAFYARASKNLKGRTDTEKEFIIGAASKIGNMGGANTSWYLKFVNDFYGSPGGRAKGGTGPQGWDVIKEHEVELADMAGRQASLHEELVNLLPGAQRNAAAEYGPDYKGDIAYFPEGGTRQPRLVDETMEALGVKDYGEYAQLTGNEQVLKHLAWLDEENAIAVAGVNKKAKTLREKIYENHSRIDRREKIVKDLKESLKWSRANEGKLPDLIDKRAQKLRRYKDDIDSVLQGEDIESWLNFIGDEVGPDALYKYKHNIKDPDFDPRPHIFRNQYAFQGKRPLGDMQAGSEVRYNLLDQMGIQRIDPRTGRLRMPTYVPSLPVLPISATRKGARAKGKADTVDSDVTFSRKGRAEGDPLELLISGDERWDLDIWLDAWERENNTFSHNAYQEHIVDNLPQLTDAQAQQAIQSGQATHMDPSTGKIDRDAATVLAPIGSGPAVEARRVQHVMEILSDELRKSGITSASKPLTKWLEDIDPLQFESMMKSGKFRKDVFADIRRGVERTAAREKGDANRYYQVPRHLYDTMVADTARSQHMLLRMIDAPTEFWKNLVLHLRPKWMVNNAVGSMFLLALSEGGFDAVRLMLKNSKTMDRVGKVMMGDEAWLKHQKSKGKIITVKGDDGVSRELTFRQYLEERMPEVSAATGSNWLYRTDFMRGSSNKFMRNYNRTMNAIADFNAKWADDPSRMAKTTAVVERRLNQIKDAYKQKGLYRVDGGSEQVLRRSDKVDPKSGQSIASEIWEDIDDGEMIQKMLNDNTIRADIADEVLGDMINFQDLTPFERDWVRRFIPFYSWIKGATKVGYKAGYEHPVRMWTLSQAGQEGTRELEERYGEGLLPSFLYSSIAGKGPNVRLAGGMNVLNTPADVTTMFANMIPFVGSTSPPYGGESPFSMMGPIPQSMMSALSGRDFYYGTPMPRGQSVGTTFLKQLINVPQVKLAQSFMDGQGPGSVSVHDPMAAFASYMGMPRAMQLRPVQVRQRAMEEREEALG